MAPVLLAAAVLLTITIVSSVQQQHFRQNILVAFIQYPHLPPFMVLFRAAIISIKYFAYFFVNDVNE